MCERNLHDFVRTFWHVLEPSQPLIDGWCLGAICEHLQAVTDGQIKKLLIMVPPGCTKSLSTSVFWPAFEWGPRNLPHMRSILASYSDLLTIRDNRRCRTVLMSPIYQRFWGDRFKLLEGEQNAKMRFDNNKTGWRIATSVGGLGTGERGDRFVVDDAAKVGEAESVPKREAVLLWGTETMPTRCNNPETSAFVIIGQRTHERDLQGHLLASDLGYDVLCLPMEYDPTHPHTRTTSIGFTDPRRVEGELLWPERFSRRYLDEELKPTLSSHGGNYAVSSQLQQAPAPRGGGLFQADKILFLDRAPEGTTWVRGWDLAASTTTKSAWTAGVLMGRTLRNQYIIANVVRARLTPGGVEELLRATAMSDGINVKISIPQDPGQSGKAQVAALAGLLAGWDVRFSPESGGKDVRATPLAAQCESGNLYLVRGSWTDIFLGELKAFPVGTYKDQVDAASRAFAALIQDTGRMRIGGGPTLVRR